MKYDDLDTIKVFTVISGILLNETSIRVGRSSEVKPGGVDLVVERDAFNRVYIPGSSLKGAMRNFVEIIARTSGEYVCNPFSEDDKRREDEKKEPCVICGIFGGGGKETSIASHIFVYDSYPLQEVRTSTRTRVAIDRFRQAARHGALFTFEFVPPNVKWNFRVEIINIDLDDESDYRTRLLRSLLQYMVEHGLHVGGMRSTGLGILRISEATISKYKVEDLELKLISSNSLFEVLKEWKKK